MTWQTFFLFAAGFGGGVILFHPAIHSATQQCVSVVRTAMHRHLEDKNRRSENDNVG